MKSIESAECHQPDPFLSGGVWRQNWCGGCVILTVFFYLLLSQRWSPAHPPSSDRECWITPKVVWTHAAKCPPHRPRSQRKPSQTKVQPWATDEACQRSDIPSQSESSQLVATSILFPVLVQVLWVRCLQYEICAEFCVASDRRANFVLQATDRQGLGTRLVSMQSLM